MSRPRRPTRLAGGRHRRVRDLARRPFVGRLMFAAPIVAALGLAVVTLFEPSPRTGATAVVDQGEPAELGAQLFATQCSNCHGVDGSGVEERGPSLQPEGEASTDFVLRTGRMPLAAPNLQARSGPVRYTEEEIVALVEYVGLIGDGPDIPDVAAERGDVANGGALYRLNCAACHVASGAGAPVGGGRQAPNLVNSTPTEVGEATLIGPGSMPVFGSLTNAEIDDIAAYIEELDAENTTAATKFGGAGPVAEGLAAWILGLIPLVALTRWIGRPKDGRDHPIGDDEPRDHPNDDDPDATRSDDDLAPDDARASDEEVPTR